MIDVVNHLALRYWPVSGFVNDVGAQPPHVGLGNLDKGSLVATPRPSSDPFSTHRQAVMRSLASLKLGARRTSFTFRGRLQVAGAFSGARIRAVVDWLAFGGFAVERVATDWAGQWRQRRMASEVGRSVLLAALNRAEHSTLCPTHTVGLDAEIPVAVGALCNSHTTDYSGSGTTLMVAHGHGFDAIGFDLDSRNADLARERVGPMFLEVHG